MLRFSYKTVFFLIQKLLHNSLGFRWHSEAETCRKRTVCASWWLYETNFENIL